MVTLGEKQERPRWYRRASGPFIDALVALYVILDAIFGIFFRPITLWLGRLRLILRVEERIAGLPAYAVLFLLALPFAVAEPAKIFALYLMGTGHEWVGLITLVAAYFVSILVVDRIFHAGEAKLMSISWFATLWRWISSHKERVLAWVKETATWKRISEMKQRFRKQILQRP